MINILMSGCNGKMGQVITRLASGSEELTIAAGYDLNNSKDNPYPVFTNIHQCDVKVDAIIDFSNPAALENILEFAVSRKIPVVMATTGLSDENIKVLEMASAEIPIFFSANMSLGVNLLLDIVKKASKILSDNFDIEIIEKHHNQKLDSPSGTALAIADAINLALEQKYEYTYDRHSVREKRSKREIGIHAVRGGTIVGEHSVIFAGNDEIIEIKHTATSKEIFAVGALRAAKFICGRKPGFYNMNDLISAE
ncbi:dihydrodipicolinate reductase [Anaerobacterium chartisolvens]|uniref:4-hydroxy-tetrahydrodipicolinate reductase n=1 Tax=Anaerobacterium chartisolvens TaxID=1297424 RepID=A0A369AXM3_9FIRM|nr:4-hydroxy-tetrahydrodipicolinate reductase [Anaerobacterium chartisolvens]RCX13835.1 dihydrodipicolinate reductase [Anaerobacterium chartisolvens]